MLTKRGILVLNSTFGLVVLASFGFDAIFTPIALIVLTVLGIETLLYARSLRALGRTSATRRISAETAFVGDNLAVDLEIRNDSRNSLGPIIVKDGTPKGFRTVTPTQDWILSIDGRSKHLIYYEMESLQIGDWDLRDVEITLTDRFGMFKAVKDIPCESRVKVYPSMRKGEELLKGRIHLGIRPIRRSAVTTPQGSEFSGIREYYQGDDVRTIAWKAMAKSALQEPKTKQHENEQSINTIFIICNSATTADGLVGNRKLDRIVETALVLAYLNMKTGGTYHIVFSRNGRIEAISGRPLDLATKLYNIGPDPKADLEALVRYGSKIAASRSLMLAVVDSPHPEKVKVSAFRGALVGNHFLHALLIDTSTYYLIHREDKVIGLARDVIVSRDQAHLRSLLSEWAEEGVTAQLCGMNNLLEKAVGVFANAGVIIEA